MSRNVTNNYTENAVITYSQIEPIIAALVDSYHL